MKPTKFLPILFFIGAIENGLQPHPMMLKGCIDSGQLKSVPPFRIYFEGMETKSNADGFFTIPLENRLDSYSLLICKDFNPEFDSINTVKHLVFDTKKVYKFYSLQKATLPLLEEKTKSLEIEAVGFEEKIKNLTMRLKLINKQLNLLKASHETEGIEPLNNRKESVSKELAPLEKNFALNKKKIDLYREKIKAMKEATPKNPASDFWIITQKKFKDKIKRAVVPDNCIVACLNPRNVFKVESWSFPLAPNFVAFPRIVLKDDLEMRNVGKIQSVTRSSLKSELFSLGKRVFHEEKVEQLKKENAKPNVQVALVQ